MRKTVMLLGVLVGALIIIGLLMYLRPSSAANNQNKTIMNNTMTTPEGLQITEVSEGTGAIAQAGDTVSVHYTGSFEDGKVFDSNTGSDAPLKFKLGAGQVIAGWDQGVAGMKVGEKRHLVIPASLGYGPNGYGPIPGGATLIFEVELLAISSK